MPRLDRFQSIDPALLDIREGMRAIDLGCGTGRHVLELSKGPGSIIGADSRSDRAVTSNRVSGLSPRIVVGRSARWANGPRSQYGSSRTISEASASATAPLSRPLVARWRSCSSSRLSRGSRREFSMQRR